MLSLLVVGSGLRSAGRRTQAEVDHSGRGVGTSR
jgi:hypothetical protein